MVVETDFLSNTNHFLYIFSETPAGKSFFSVSRKLSFERILHSGHWQGFFSLMEVFTLLESFFLLAKTISAINGNELLRTKLILAGGNWFFGQGKSFCFIVSYISERVFHPDWRKRKVLFFIQSFLSCWWKPILKL